MAKVEAIRRQVRLSRVTAERLDLLAERMGMTKQQTLTVLVAQAVTSALRATDLVAAKQDDFLNTFIQGELDAGSGDDKS